MNFDFSEEQLLIIEEATKFSKEELEPKTADLDEKGEVNLEALKKLGDLGFMGMMVPEKYSGSDAGAIAYAGSMIEFSKADAGISVAISVHNSLVTQGILKYGTEEQREKYLHKLATGEYLSAFSLSEANCGSDPASLQMEAVYNGEHYILNGTKNFTSNGSFADFFIVFAQTDKSKGSRGISAFIVEKDTAGFAIGKHENKMGIRTSSTTELIFTDCIIPKNNLLGNLNEGLKLALSLLDGGRIGIAAQAIGIAEAALEEAIKYSKERVQFKAPISNLQSIRFMLAEMATDIEMAKTMLYRVAWMKESGLKSITKNSAMLKLFASQMSHRVVHKALQIHGGYGYMKEYKIERLYRDQRITEIYEGTSEIQKLVIARKLLD